MTIKASLLSRRGGMVARGNQKFKLILIFDPPAKAAVSNTL